ncbi:MAG: T9SS type A sorting domain-containing protein, partial [Chitinophagales bacterium]
AAFNATGTEVCAGDYIGFADASIAATSWSWLFPGGTPTTSSLANPLILYDTPGVYDVTLVVTNGFGSDLLTLDNYISVYANPTLEVSAGPGTATVNVLSGAAPYTYSWSDGQNTATAIGLIPGDYTVTVTDANGCAAAISVTVTQPSAIDNILDGLELQIYPNPVSDFLLIDLQLETMPNDLSMIVNDVLGKTVLNNPLVQGITTIEMQDLAPGVYTAKILSDSLTAATFSFVKN